MKEIHTESLEQAVQQTQEYIIRYRRYFHQHPELSLQEYHTAETLEKELERLGIAHKRIGETGVLGIIHGQRGNGRVVALRADMDALPIQETGKSVYCSQRENVMHACGHDAHTACLLGAAKILQESRKGFAGEVRLIFQPAEEIGKGAFPFIEQGALEGVSRVMGLHIAPGLPCGTVGITPGLNNAAVDHFKILVHGKSAHVSAPQLGVDALYTASQIVVALQALVTRRTSPTEPVIIGIGKLSSGTSYNIVAEEAELEGTTRTVSLEMRAQIKEQINTAVRNIADAYGAQADVIWTDIASPVINDEGVCAELAGVVGSVYGGRCPVVRRELSLGGDNFAEFLLQVPGAYLSLGTGNPEKPQTLHSLHHNALDIEENALVIGTGLYVQAAFWWLSAEELA